MSRHAAANCSICGKQLLTSQQTCLACDEPSRANSVPARPGPQLTPPPSAPSSPRRSLGDEPKSLPRRTRARVSDASEALDRAFSSQEEESSSSFFPKSFYHAIGRPSSHELVRASARRAPYSDSSVETVNSLVSLESKGTHSLSLTRQTTPEIRFAEYAPMAAGFARLSRKDADSDPDHVRRMRSSSARPNMLLNARMFEGPA